MMELARKMLGSCKFIYVCTNSIFSCLNFLFDFLNENIANKRLPYFFNTVFKLMTFLHLSFKNMSCPFYVIFGVFCLCLRCNFVKFLWLTCVMIFSGITFHCCLVTLGTCAVVQIIETMCFRLMAIFASFCCVFQISLVRFQDMVAAVKHETARLARLKAEFLAISTLNEASKEDGDVQVSALVNTIGREAEHVYKSFTLAEGDEEKFDVILPKFDEHLVPKRNVIHERVRFYQRNQREGETVEPFRSLYEIAEHCDFTTSRDQQTRDRIVIGILDKNVSQKLQLKADLTLEAAIQIARQSEMMKS